MSDSHTPPTWVVLTLVALLMCVFALVGLSLSQHNVCLRRLQYDNEVVTKQSVEAQQYKLLAQQERTNRFIDNTLRQQRVAAYEAIIAADERIVRDQVHTNCL